MVRSNFLVLGLDAASEVNSLDVILLLPISESNSNFITSATWRSPFFASAAQKSFMSPANPRIAGSALALPLKNSLTVPAVTLTALGSVRISSECASPPPVGTNLNLYSAPLPDTLILQSSNLIGKRFLKIFASLRLMAIPLSSYPVKFNSNI